MDDVVAVKVKDAKGQAHYFITWGRIFDRVDPKGLESLVAKHAPKYGIKSVRSVTVCDSLQLASKARYFYEALLRFSPAKIPFGKKTYEPWRAKVRVQMSAGSQLFYCGIRKQKKYPQSK
jgi:hypothetical protein